MRRTHTIGTVIVAAVIGAQLWTVAPAMANGGAYLSFDQTYYAPGSEVSVEAYVYVPEKRADLLDRGPFWLYALSDGTRFEVGAPIPDGAIRLAALTVVAGDDDEYELEATFPMPAAAPGSYDVAVCNDPCTVSGFGEPLFGVFTLAGSQREIVLLKENEELRARASNLEREVRKVRKDAGEVEATYVTAVAEGRREDGGRGAPGPPRCCAGDTAGVAAVDRHLGRRRHRRRARARRDRAVTAAAPARRGGIAHLDRCARARCADRVGGRLVDRDPRGAG
jgi:hypothetical protein